MNMKTIDDVCSKKRGTFARFVKREQKKMRAIEQERIARIRAAAKTPNAAGERQPAENQKP